MTEYGAFTGLPLDLPPGKHPFDPCLQVLTHILGERKTAAFLGVPYGWPTPTERAEDEPPITTVVPLAEYL